MFAPLFRWTTIMGQYQLFAFTTPSSSMKSRRQVDTANWLFYVDILRMLAGIRFIQYERDFFLKHYAIFVSAIGWITIASTDNMNLHIGSFIVFIILSFVDGILSLKLLAAIVDSRDAHVDSRNLRRSLSWKRFFFGVQLALLLPIGYFYYRHITHCESGAYSKYNLCEWSWALANIFYDACTYFELRTAVQIRVLFDATSIVASSSSTVATTITNISSSSSSISDVPKNK